MNDDQERPIRMMIVYAGSEGGFYLVLAPAVVSEERLAAALRDARSRGGAGVRARRLADDLG